ncbi:ABC transporter ATP-binding protein [Actinoplanes sp. OR16]|uniref:dipeptide ABC transporter ATP-binding protein n=1 Tax=Actinoplanes sp. OR16 TaxID=946334 RepID=UPI000F6B411F|nr:dipeptide ABC transporter ATP-binding protein [Actinoplanes sp. OR16]BBH70272.1 ABC transporter ATP-binding protein [Actinoplanes sp. OR16]
MTTPPLLQVRGLRVEFGGVPVVRDVDLTVPAGGALGLVGESGSGKSVTARSVLRLLRPGGRVTGGQVLFDGRDLLGLSEKRMRQVRGHDIAMVFQDPQSALNPVLTVGDQVAEALIVHGAGRRAARTRAAELLDLVGIPQARQRMDDHPHQFSGGMRQRVVIATALANRPRLLIADEPTTALDVTVQAQILRLLAGLRAELGVALLMITHDLGVVAETCDEAAVMYAGRIVENGPVRELFGHAAHPYTAALLRAAPRLDGDRSVRLPAITGAPPDPAALPPGCAFHPRCPIAVARCSAEQPPVTAVAAAHEAVLPAAYEAVLPAVHEAVLPAVHEAVLPAAHEAVPPGAHEAACWRPSEPFAEPAGDGPALHRAGGERLLTVAEVRVNVTGGRKRPVWAVDGVSLHVDAGETLGLVGESGCGKSTLARAIVGLRRADHGTVRADGDVRYVFQDPYASLNPRRTIRQTVSEALQAGGVTGAAARRRAAELMETVGLTEAHLERYPAAFSGGQRQRIGIARALATNPRLLILDEPVSALDVSVQAQVVNLLADLRDRLGLGYLFIAHDLAVVRHLSDRVAVMYLGRIVETGPAEQIYAKPRHPYTAALISAVPQGAANDGLVLRGDLPDPANPPSGCRFRTRCPIGADRGICAEKEPALGADGVACHFPGEVR